MTSVERHLDRVLETLRAAILSKGVTQLEIQQSLGWGLTYISHLLKKQKQIRFDQLYMILNVIDVEPGDFFAEVFAEPKRSASRAPRASGPLSSSGPSPGRDSRHLRALLDALVLLLEKKKLITAEELSLAVEAAQEQLLYSE